MFILPTKCGKKRAKILSTHRFICRVRMLGKITEGLGEAKAIQRLIPVKFLNPYENC